MPAFSNVWIYICDILNNIAMGKKRHFERYRWTIIEYEGCMYKSHCCRIRLQDEEWVFTLQYNNKIKQMKIWSHTDSSKRCLQKEWSFKLYLMIPSLQFITKLLIWNLKVQSRIAIWSTVLHISASSDVKFPSHTPTPVRKKSHDHIYLGLDSQ